MGSRLDAAGEHGDAVLVERHLAGDETAFATLYQRHHARLVRYVRRRLYERHIAEDVAQEAFAQALYALPALRNPARFYPWLTAIARHLIARHHRRAARQWLVADVDGAAPDAPEAELLRHLDELDVHRALERVQDRYREVLELRETLELSYEDIAIVLGTPLTTVPPLLHRARAALRREFLSINGPQYGLPPALLTGWRVRFQRLRARADQFLAWLPDAHILCASFTCLAIGAAGLLPSLLAPISSGPRFDGAQFGPDWPRADYGHLVTRPDGTTRQTGFSPTHGANAGRPDAVIPGVAEAGINNPQRTNWARERAREMPIYQEFGPTWFAADPEQMRRDIEATLAGDPDWMEGACGDDCFWER